ncbi:MAG: polysaccharide biosynthesis protein [Oscillospiraceae bacterium]|jgi:stage V sporulation protein B|nr:polysaccharide biosynthesis protein [Oscillospiraceae bacterium]
MYENKKPNFLKSAAILAVTGIFVKIIGAIYKIPILNILGDEGSGYFHVTYNVYAMILAISTAGVPVALSRLVSSALARNNTLLIKRYFSVAMPFFASLGLVLMAAMFFFAGEIARLMNFSLAAYGIRVLAPAVFFVCLISVYRGYAQGFENMIPTALSQAVEVVCKAVFGIGVAFFLVRTGYESHYVSAGSITGVTIGLGLCIPLMIFFKKKLDKRILQKSEASELPNRIHVFLQIMKVSIPITFSASFMAIMNTIDTGVVLGRLQSALMLTESEAAEQLGIFAKGFSIYNLPPALIVPVAVSIIPAIAAAIARKNKDEARSIVKSSVKLTNLIAMPASAGIMVLAGPILQALYYDLTQTPETVATMTTILVILGAASYFVCFQHLTIAVLQANGHERVALMTFPAGALVKITLSYILVANPNIGIVGSPIGTLACYTIITALNILFIIVKVKERMNIVNGFLKPLVCALVTGAVAWLTYEGVRWLGADIFGTGYSMVRVYLALAIFVGVFAYIILVVITRTIAKEDLIYVPKGEKLAKLLRVR